MTNQNDERAAREWLKEAGQIDDFYGVNEDTKHRATILRMLDRQCPRGADVPDDVVDSMVKTWYAGPCDSVGMRDCINVMHAHLTARRSRSVTNYWRSFANMTRIRSAQGTTSST